MENMKKIKVKRVKYISAKKFERWKIDSIQERHIVNINECDELKSKECLRNVSPKLRRCYEAAFECTIACSDVKFVLGYGINKYGMVCDHSWNMYKSIDFDLMTSLGVSYDMYYKILELSSTEIFKYAARGGELMDHAILEHFYKKKFASSEDYVSIPEKPEITLRDYIIDLLK